MPGLAPRSYQPDEPVKLFVDKLTSTHTQIPYDYYSLPYCHPHIHESPENIGMRLSGDRMENSLYKMEMMVGRTCAIICKKKLNKEQSKMFTVAIDAGYRIHWLLDGLPVSTMLVNDVVPDQPYLSRGFPVGFKEKNKHYLYNHIRIIVSYNEDLNEDPAKRKFEGIRVVGFRVEPFSVQHEWEGDEFSKDMTPLTTCNQNSPVSEATGKFHGLDKAGDVVFTYDVRWEESETLWSNRWDVYLASGNPDDKIHWFSITTSTLIVVFLTSMVAMILVRALSSDIAQYNDPNIEEAKEESGWKLVHGHVFRAPETSPMLFAVCIGTGTQLFMMMGATLFFALLGFLSPANRGSLITALLLLFVLMGSFAGYYSSRMYKFFRGEDYKRNSLYTAFAFPALVFGIFLVLDICLFFEGSSGAVPFSTLFTLIALWFGVSTPLVFIGSYMGYKKEAYAPPVGVNLIARLIPPQPWFMHPALSILFSGILPFGAVSVELFFIMSAVWLHQIYYIFGFLFLVMIILVATCAETTILMCYFQLCLEDYRWWWRSLLSSGSCALYIFLYAIWYFIAELDITGVVPSMLYFGYMFVISCAFFLLASSIGFFSCFWFVDKIYSSIKVD